VLRTLAVVSMVMVTGLGPQANVITPPAATASTTAADVQLAAVPVPITWSGWAMLTGWPAAGTGAMPVPLLTGACDGAAGALVFGFGTRAIPGVPTLWGRRAASWAGRAGAGADRDGAAPPGFAAVVAGPEAAHAVSVTAVNRVAVSAVAVLVSRTMFDHIQIRGDQWGFWPRAGQAVRARRQPRAAAWVSRGRTEAVLTPHRVSPTMLISWYAFA
jgi:hypothetical protein